MNSMPGEVIIPLDGSKAAEHAVPLGLFLARTYGAPVRLVHVMDTTGRKAHDEEVSRARKVFADYASDLVTRLNGESLACRAELLIGNPADKILEASEGATAIVLASHGRGGFRAAFIGSVADKVVRGAKVPVLVVPGLASAAVPPKMILVPIDGSPQADRALQAARFIAEKAGAQVAVFTAFSLLPPGGFGFGYAYGAYSEELAEQLEEAAKERVAKAALPGERQVVFMGDAASGIVEAANQLDAGLVVMSTRGLGLARRFVLGSTADRVLHALHRPLLLLPGGDD
jgi:nucleotide-binding universal stress UspA family protein